MFKLLCRPVISNVALPIRRSLHGIGQSFSYTRNGSYIIAQRCISSTSSRDIRSKEDVEKDPQNIPLKTSMVKAFAKESELFLRENDPDTFGTISGHIPKYVDVVDEKDEDAGDAAERDFLENKPMRRQKLTTKQYATMIKAHFRNHCVKEAIEVLEIRMKEDRVKPENYIYNLLISELARLGYAQKAFSLYNRMKQRDLKVTGATYTALFNACAMSPFASDGLKKARRLREIMLEKGYEPNITNYHAMMKAFGRCGDIATAFELLDEMKEKKLPLKVETFNFLLQASVSDKDFGFRHALLVWHKIYRHGMKPDIFSYNTMLRCARDCGIGDVETMQQAIGTVMFSTKKSLPPKVSTLRLESGIDGEIISINAKPSTIDAQENVSRRQTETLPDLVSHNTDQPPNLLSKLPHLGNLMALGQITKPEEKLMLIGGVDGILNEIELVGQVPSVKTFTQLLALIPENYEAEQNLILRMKKLGVRTDVDFFNVLMKKRTNRLDYDGAKKVLDMITIAGLARDIVTYGILAMGCKTIEAAQDFLNELESKGVRPNMPILGALLQNGCISNNYAYIIDILQLVKELGLKPNGKFIDIIESYCSRRYPLFKSPSETVSESDIDDFFKFYRELGLWKRNMGFQSLKKTETMKLLREHPYNQFRENHVEGAEFNKNTKMQKLWKKGHFLQKFSKSKFTGNGGIRLPKKEPLQLESTTEEEPETKETVALRKRKTLRK